MKINKFKTREKYLKKNILSFIDAKLYVVLPTSLLGIQVQNSKKYFDMEALSIGCRNKH